MSRISADELKEILPTTISSQGLTPFIVAADALVDEVLSGSSGLNETLLKEIVRWLAAHFLASSRERSASVIEQEIDTARTRFSSERILGEGLKSTQYGITALALDTTGNLAQLGKSRASFCVFGGSSEPIPTISSH